MVGDFAIRYPYACRCGHDWEVIKSVKQIDDPEMCGMCGEYGTRYIAKSQYFYGADDWNRAEYQPAFGEYLTPQQARKKAKEQGLIEWGNEDPDKIAAEKAKDREKKREERYNKITDTSLGEIR